MKRYLVGGYVRDYLLKIPSEDRDFVVVGSSCEEMLQEGFMQINSSFPVFLHPVTKEQYALARMDFKVGNRHQSFKCVFDKSTSLWEDTLRRDITINAIAMDDDGQIYDYHGGVQDLHDRVIKHVSDAFTEDPLRVLRVARFYAKLASLGFNVSHQTEALIRTMVKRGELDNLSCERISIEFYKASLGDNFYLFIATLKHWDVFEHIMRPLQHLSKSTVDALKATQSFSSDRFLILMSILLWNADTPDVKSMMQYCVCKKGIAKEIMLVLDIKRLLHDEVAIKLQSLLLVARKLRSYPASEKIYHTTTAVFRIYEKDKHIQTIEDIKKMNNVIRQQDYSYVQHLVDPKKAREESEIAVAQDFFTHITLL